MPATDAQGNQLYKGAVIQPFVRGDDGNAYRVSRDQYGNQHYFNIADGADGTDFHTDPSTGEQFVQVPGADGTSRRETVGQDNFIPTANGIKALAQTHQDNAEQASQAAARAEQGVAGADGYGSLSLAELRQSQAAAAQGAADAQKVLDNLPAYGLNATQVNQRDAAYAAINQYGGLAQEQSDAVSARENAITQAQQQRTASMSSVRDLAYVRNQITAARQDDNAPLNRNLAAVAAGQDIDPTQAKRYAAAGLLAPQQRPDGSTGFALTDTAQKLLPKPDAPAAPAVDPAASLTAPASLVQPPQPQQSAASNLAQPLPGESTADFQAGVSSANASRAAAAQVGGNSSGTAPAPASQGQGGQPQDTQTQPAKLYRVGVDGSISYDPFNLSGGLLAAYKDGLVSDEKLKEMLPQALSAEQSLAKQNPPTGGDAAVGAGQSTAKAQPEGFWATAGRAFASKIAPALGTAAGGLGAGALAIESGPGAVAADIAGGALAGAATDKLQRSVMGEDWARQNDAQMAANAQAHPIAAQIGTIAPFLISLLGGGGGTVKAGATLLGRAVTTEGKQAIQDAAAAGAQYMAPTVERIAQAAAGGARAGASEGAREKYVEGKDVSVLDSAARGALTMGATGGFAPPLANTAVGLFPMVKTLLTNAVERGVKDGAAMTLAGDVYDAAVHGKPFDLANTAKEMGGSIPVFVLQNALMGLFHAKMSAPPSASGESGSDGSANGPSGPASPDDGSSAAPSPVAPPPTAREQLNMIDLRLDQIRNSSADHSEEREALIAQRGDLMKNLGGQAATSSTADNGQSSALPAGGSAGAAPTSPIGPIPTEGGTVSASDEPTVTRQGGMSTVRQGGTSLTVPISQEAQTIALMRGSAQRQPTGSAPIDGDATPQPSTNSIPAVPAPDPTASDLPVAPAAGGQSRGATSPQVISSASFADVVGQPGQASTQDALTQRTQALNGQMQAALSKGQRVDMVRTAGDGTESRQQVSRAPDGRMVDEAGNTVRAGAALTPETRFEISPPGSQPPEARSLPPGQPPTPGAGPDARAPSGGSRATPDAPPAPASTDASSGGGASSPVADGTVVGGAGSSAQVGDSTSPATGQTVPEMTLPRDLAGAKPRYAYGAKQYQLSFESDLDKTAYTLAQDGQNKRHADYLRTAQDQTGLSEQQLIDHGKTVRDTVKMMARDGDPAAGPLQVPKQSVAGRVSGDVAPEAPARGSGEPTPARDPSAAGRPDAGGHPPLPPVGDSLRDASDTSSSTDNLARDAARTPAAGEPSASTPPTDAHRALSDLVNSGAATDNPEGKPSVQFSVLSRLRNAGVDVSPELARDTEGPVRDIMSGGGSDVEKQSALKQLIRDHFPTESHTDPVPAGSDATSARPATDAASEPTAQPRIVSAPRPDDTPNTIKAREWLADQRQAGQTPSVMNMVSALKVRPDIARRILADQQAAEQALTQQSGESSQTSAQAPTERQPTTGNGKTAAKVIEKLTAKKAEQNGFLSPLDETTLANWRSVLDRDLNQQALGPNPQPTTEAGKAARRTILALETARDAGAALSPSDHASWKNALATLQSDFTQQRQAIDAKQAQPAGAPATDAASTPSNAVPTSAATPPANPPPASASAPSAPTTSTPAAAFKPRQEVVYKGRPAVVESIDGDRAVVRVRAGQDPKTGVNLGPKRVTNVAISSLQERPGRVAPSEPPAESVPVGKATATAQRQIKANRPMLDALGVKKVEFRSTGAASGVEFASDGTLRIAPSKLAASMTTVRDSQARNGIAGTPEDWFSQVLAHEGIHAADIQVAKAKGQTIEQRYDALPAKAMPEGWQATARKVYGPEFDNLSEWQQKAEFVRQVVEGKWTGKITEQLYKHIQEAIDYLKSVAGFEGTDPRFKAHVEELESRIAAARGDQGEQIGDGSMLGAAQPDSGDHSSFPEDRPFDLTADALPKPRMDEQQNDLSSRSPGNEATTYDSVVGDKINARRTAFASDSGTLGIPRDQMPQVAAEHRGAMAQFLQAQARGMDVSAQDELPGSLKPSQADFFPAKVAKAAVIREAGDAAPRRILTSSDGYVVDGHHQWLDRLQNAPDEPMPTLKINAPARDILSQIHEFPSAGLEKAPDLEPRIASAAQAGDTPKITAAREWLADQRQAGNDPTAGDVVRTNKVPLEVAQQILADQQEAERGGSTLAAAKPGDDEDPLTKSLFSKEEPPTPAKKGNLIQRTRDEFTRARTQMANDDRISHRFDAVENYANEMGDQAATGVRLDIKDTLDRQAATALMEAGGDRARLAEDLAKVKASPDQKLANEMAPIYQHALDNSDRLSRAADGYRQRDLAEDAAAEQAGLTPQWQARAKHVLDDPLSPESTVVADHGFGATKGFPTQADAIAAGVRPKSMDLADMARARVYNNQRLIGEKAFHDELTSMKAADGKPIIGGMVETSERLRPGGTPTVEQKVPKGYEAVQAGNNLLTVHKDYAPLVRALYDPSAIQAHPLGRAVLKAVAIAKHYTLLADTFHVARLFFKELTHGGGIGYGKGVSILEASDADLARQVQSGELTQDVADYARKNRPAAQELIAAGYNVGKMGDNLAEAAHLHLPGISKFNDWVFKKFSRGAMLQTALAGLERNLKRYQPEMDAGKLSRADVVRQTAKEYNEVFGNMGHQGLFKSATMQDVARLALLAPNWTESQFRSEARGLGQMGKVVTDAATGKGLRAGNVAQGMAAGIVGLVAANQIINLATRGKPTWQNEEEGHKFDAWLPGGPHNRGFFFGPMELTAEFTHAMMKYMGGGDNAVDAATHIASNKLSGVGRALKDLVTGVDYKGQPYGSMGERLKAAAVDALPSPLPLGAFLQKNPQAPLGYGLNHEKGAVEKQAFGMVGMKLENAPSARNQMYAMADRFKNTPEGAKAMGGKGVAAGGNQARPASPYGDLRRYLDNVDEGAARDEVQRLVTEGGKSLPQVGKALGIQNGKVNPELFTGSLEGDRKMVASLTPVQAQLWHQALNDRVASARLFGHIVDTLPSDQRRAVQLASAANSRGNKSGAAQVGKSSVLAPQTRPVGGVPVQPAAPAPKPHPSITSGY